jgi:tRNA1Val (adenine37-N6)-methyltransferase
MLAQRTDHAVIDAVEIDTDSACCAAANVRQSPWAARINVITASFLSFAHETAARYDLLVSNPPYFVNALLPASEQRAVARHAAALPYPDLIAGALRLLTPEGRLSVVLPHTEGATFTVMAEAEGLHCTHKVHVSSVLGKPPKRSLLLFARQPSDALHESLLAIHLPNLAGYTTDYQVLTSDFYLKF